MTTMWRRIPDQWRDHVIVACLAVAASIAGLLNDFVYDDVPIIRDNVRVHSLTNLGDILTQPYWPPPFIQNLYRPFAVLLLAVEYTIGGGSPLVFRVVSYVLYAACSVGMLLLARPLVSRNAALAAAALFAVHPVHVEAVALGVNQGELVVAGIALLMTHRYVTLRATGPMRSRDWLVLCMLYALAGLTKEQGYIIPSLLFASELLVVQRNGAAPHGGIPWRGFAALAATGGALLLARSVVLDGRLGGATPYVDLVGLTPVQRVSSMLQVVPEWLRLLVWPERLQVDFAPGTFAYPTQFNAAQAIGLFVGVAVVATLVVCWRRAPVVSLGLAWCLLALLPVSNIVPTGIMLAERTLFLPSIGFMLAIAAICERVLPALDGRSPGMRRVLPYVCMVLIALGLVRSANRHAAWNSAHLRVAAPSGP